jgi:hypothetical protein
LIDVGALAASADVRFLSVSFRPFKTVLFRHLDP